MEADIRNRLRRRVWLNPLALAQRVGRNSGTVSQLHRGQIQLSTSDIERIVGATEADLNTFPAPSVLAEVVSGLSRPLVRQRER